MHPIVARAEEFIWRNARLLERRLYAYHFRHGSRDEAISALLAYRNADGGFGNALEPDIRCPDSQPVPAQHALEILDTVGMDGATARGICDYLVTITTGKGGVPFVLPTVNAYPHAPWWTTGDNPPASLNPTAAIAGLLHKNGIAHPWLERATEFCWSRIAGQNSTEAHEMACIVTFLRYAPPRERAEAELMRIGQHLLASGLVADVQAEGYVRKPLDWAATPDHPWRGLFRRELIDANLDWLTAQQRDDGGWGIAFPPVSPAGELEWRGWVTLANLLILRANGRLA